MKSLIGKLKIKILLKKRANLSSFVTKVANIQSSITINTAIGDNKSMNTLNPMFCRA